jgi:hypothetical protein
LAAFLGEPPGTPVIDMTGLKGRHDFAVFQAALPKQLALKLEARKLPVEVLIIDHVEKAAVEN